MPPLQASPTFAMVMQPGLLLFLGGAADSSRLFRSEALSVGL